MGGQLVTQLTEPEHAHLIHRALRVGGRALIERLDQIVNAADTVEGANREARALLDRIEDGGALEDAP